MKTCLKSIAAAAIAAFTFGFAPSAMAASITVTQAQQRYPWTGQFDITYTASGIAEACGSTKIAKLKVWAVNPATQEEQIATTASLSGDTTMADGNHSLVWDMDAQGILQGLVTDELTICVTALAEDKPKPLGGVQLWEGGPFFAETNIGAENPQDTGYFFWWGDTVGCKRKNNTWVMVNDETTQFYFTGSNVPTNSKTLDELKTLGYIDDASSPCLNAAYDAATQYLGAPWRIMTEGELDKLVNTSYCTRKWTTKGGVSGWEVTGAQSGYTTKSIFLPVTGCGYSYMHLNNTSMGYGWTSTPIGLNAHYLKYSSGSFEKPSNPSGRSYGYPIRPVRSANTNAAGNGDPEVLCTGELDAAADLRTGTIRDVAATETLTYTTNYPGGAVERARVTIVANETLVASGLKGSGTVEWTPDPNYAGVFTLQNIVYISGAGTEVTNITAQFYAQKEELALKDASGNTVDVKLNRSWAAEKTGTTDPTAQATALNVKQDNGHRMWENEILGLNGSVSTSIPVIAPVQTSDPGQVGFRLSGVNVDTTSGASVSNKVWKGSEPGAHTTGYGPYLYTEQVDVPVPESGVQYYDIEVLIK